MKREMEWKKSMSFFFFAPFQTWCRINDEKQAGWRTDLFHLDLIGVFFLNLHSSPWICKEEGSLDGYGLKMEKTLYQEGEKRKGKREGKKTFSGMSVSEQAEGIVS